MFINIKISHFAIKNGGYNKEMILLTKKKIITNKFYVGIVFAYSNR